MQYALAAPPNKQGAAGELIALTPVPLTKAASPPPTKQGGKPSILHEPRPPIQSVWLVVPQTMAQVQQDGGIHPQGTTGTSVYQHVKGARDSIYVTVYETEEAALAAFDGSAEGTLVNINALENTIPVAETLNWLPIAKLNQYVSIGGIRLAQIISSVDLVHGQIPSAGKRVDVPNAQYRRMLFSSEVSGNGCPQLAGLPTNHPAIGQAPFSNFDQTKSDMYVDEYMKMHGKTVQYRGKFPLIIPPSEIDVAYAKISKAGVEIKSAETAAKEAKQAGDSDMANNALAKAQAGSFKIRSELRKQANIIFDSMYLNRPLFDKSWKEAVDYFLTAEGVHSIAWETSVANLQKRVVLGKDKADGGTLEVKKASALEMKAAVDEAKTYAARMHARHLQTENRISELDAAKSQAKLDPAANVMAGTLWLGYFRESKPEAIYRERDLRRKISTLQLTSHGLLLGMCESAENYLKQLNKEIEREEGKEGGKETKQGPETVVDAQKAAKAQKAMQEAQKIQDGQEEGSWIGVTLKAVGVAVGVVAAADVATAGTSYLAGGPAAGVFVNFGFQASPVPTSEEVFAYGISRLSQARSQQVAISDTERLIEPDIEEAVSRAAQRFGKKKTKVKAAGGLAPSKRRRRRAEGNERRNNDQIEDREPEEMLEAKVRIGGRIVKRAVVAGIQEALKKMDL
ncbi:hypothetical protein RJ55_04067 [Drechmeria coniospora]|nr:hypothetical protein RJ55_04067 [Drechmeria coniospora]